MIDYTYKFKDGDVQECDSCGCVAPLYSFRDSSKFPEDKEATHELCELCASSTIGTASNYPEQHDNVPLFQAIAQVGNIILDKTTDRLLSKVYPKED